MRYLLFLFLLGQTMANTPNFEGVEGSKKTEEQAVKVPETAIEGDINAMVDEILDSSKEKSVKKIIANRFPYTASRNSAYLLELWRTLGAYRGERAGKAFDRYGNFLLKEFDSLETRNELHFEKFSSPQEKFVIQVERLKGPGTARVRTRVIQHFKQKIDGHGDSKNGQYKTYRYGNYLSRLLQGVEAVGTLQEMAIQDNEGDIGEVFYHVLHNDSYYGEKNIGNLLAATTLDLTRDFLTNFQANTDKKRRLAHSKSRMLGRVLNQVFIALELRQKDRTKRNPQPSVAHGASILKFATKGIDILTGGLSSGVTGIINKGIDKLAKYEKSQEKDKGAEALAELKQHFASLVLAVFDQQISRNATIEREDRLVMKEEFTQQLKEGFKLNGFQLK